MKKPITNSLLFLSFCYVACENFQPPAPLEEELLDGPVEGLSYEETQRFLAGDIAFNDEIFTTNNGLGPVFVSTSCGSCHAGDGKGHPFSALTRFGQSAPGENQFLDQGGPQLQHRAIPGYQPEQIPAGASFTKLVPPANTGLGFLELVPDATLLSLADPNDLDGDGISGVPNWKPLPDYITPPSNAIEQNGMYIHRFGKKAASFNLLHQTVLAYNEDIGIRSSFEAKDVYTGWEMEPEVSDQTVNDVVFYLQTLKAPIQRNQDDSDVIAGENIFKQISCGKCHTPEMQTGFSTVEALSNKTFYPYTDLLLHDMGPGLDDNYTEGSAETYEWRTPALWGLGLSPNSQGGEYFLMHDGRAKSIEEAILLHGGEALQSKQAYENLSTTEKNQLIQFLESL